MNLQKIILLIILQVIEFLIFVFRILHINIKSFFPPTMVCFAKYLRCKIINLFII